ncbi:MAG TPA: hypothetical protein DEA73_03765 [Peptococcaceae bacterium]|nr:hypothetical protein [Peptococcaceae bacterium]
MKRLEEKGLVQKKGSQFFRLSKGGDNGTNDPSQGVRIEELYALLLENFQIGLRDGYDGSMPHDVNLDAKFWQFLVSKLRKIAPPCRTNKGSS